ncbi:hypothetical protein ABZX85_47560 [Streptomyces sp. NPDC004539]|uniref:hypothetical protein n=1 Tax=Streptomyces sp. NPDC004539 TaxID=3154280 RepID=UPI0033B55772
MPPVRSASLGEARVGRREVREGRVLPQRVVDGLHDVRVDVPDPGENTAEGVAEGIAERLDTRSQEQRQLVDHLLVGEASGISHEPGRDAGAGLIAFEGHQLTDSLVQDVGRLLGVGAVEHAGDTEVHPVADPRGHPKSSSKTNSGSCLA